MKNKDLSFYLNSLIVWAEEKGYCVSFDENGDNCVCTQSKIIEINSSAPLRSQVYYLLHECGHVAIDENGSFWNYKKNPTNFYNKPPSEYESKIERDSYRVYTVIEEVEAWKRGFNLACRLGIPIPKDEWEKEMLDAIAKYIDWAVS